MSEEKKGNGPDRKPGLKAALTFAGTLVFVTGALYVITLFTKESFLEKISHPRWIIVILVASFGTGGGMYARMMKKASDEKHKHRVINDREI